MKCAVIDIGSNTMRMNIYSITKKKSEVLFRKKTFASLVSYTEDGVMTDEGISVLIKSLTEFKNVLDKLKIKNAFPFATASIRNVSNSAQIIAKIKQELGWEVDLISGEREAILGYEGLEKDLQKKDGINIDVGGGSAEILVYKDKKIINSNSMDVGSLSLYSKNVASIFPTETEAKQMSEIVKQKLISLNIDIESLPKHVTGIGGSARAILDILNHINNDEKNNEFTKQNLEMMINLVVSKDIKMLKDIVKLQPERIHTLTSGMIIFHCILDYFNLDSVKVSSRGIRDGYLAYKISGMDI